jgi:ribonuclease P protein component
MMGEANLPAQEAQEDAHTRVSGPDVDAGGPSGAQGAAAERPPQAERLIWRIRDRATFAELANGRRRRRGPISMTFLPGDPSLPPRVAYAVGKRVGPAVVRNRVRRRLRAATQGHRAELQPGGTYLFGAGPAAACAPFAEIDAAMGALLAARGPS